MCNKEILKYIHYLFKNIKIINIQGSKNIGKTTLLNDFCIQTMIDVSNTCILYFSHVITLSQISQNIRKKFDDNFNKIKIKKTNRNYIELDNKSTLLLYSHNNSDSLIGALPTHIIIDNFELVYNKVLLDTLLTLSEQNNTKILVSSLNGYSLFDYIDNINKSEYINFKL